MVQPRELRVDVQVDPSDEAVFVAGRPKKKMCGGGARDCAPLVAARYHVVMLREERPAHVVAVVARVGDVDHRAHGLVEGHDVSVRGREHEVVERAAAQQVAARFPPDPLAVLVARRGRVALREDGPLGEAVVVVRDDVLEVRAALAPAVRGRVVAAPHDGRERRVLGAYPADVVVALCEHDLDLGFRDVAGLDAREQSELRRRESREVLFREGGRVRAHDETEDG